MQLFHRAVVRLPDPAWLDPVIELDPKVNAFSGCIGAIDGTHVAAFVRASESRAWRDHNGNLSQNVFAAVRSGYLFSYVLAGAEGSMNDATLLAHALTRGFHVPGDRFYLADAGFGERQGVVTPFSGVIYHLPEQRARGRVPKNNKELYNHRHSQHRVLVEQAFGLLKRTWGIVRSAPPEYSIAKQKEIIYATTALHNLVRLQRRRHVPLEAGELEGLQEARERAARLLPGLAPCEIRFQIAHLLADQYRRYTGETVEEAYRRQEGIN